MPTMTGAQAVVISLEAEGVDAVFTLPGVQVMPIFDALHTSATIRLISCRHEQATTYAADGYARVTGKPGVALVVPGPGAMNAASGLGTAYATSSPVLLLSGQILSSALGKGEGQLHEIDDELDLFRPITKWNARITAAKDIPAAIHRAFEEMTSGRPRPVELEIPPDTLADTGEADIIEMEKYPKLPGDPDLITRAAKLLYAAERPAVWAGGGTLRARAGAELAAVAEHIQAPVVTTQQAKGVLPAGHPLYVGVNYTTIGLGARVLSDSDVVLVAGSRFLVAGYEMPDGQTIIHIDADGAEIGKNYPAEIGIVADTKAGLSALAQALQQEGPRGFDGQAGGRDEKSASRLPSRGRRRADRLG